MSRSFSAVLGSMLVVFFVIPASPGAGKTGPVEVDQFVERALEENQKLRSLRDKTESLRQAVDPAASLENPRLQAGAMNLPVDSYEFDEAPMTSRDLALNQKIPFYGKRDQRAKRAIARYRISRAEWAAFRIKLAHDVRKTLFDWWSLQKIIELRREERKQLRSFVDVARSRYETGDVTRADVQRAHSRLSRIEDNLLQLRQRERRARDRLERLMGGAEVPSGRDPTLPVSDVELSNLENWKRTLPTNSPRLRADSEQIQAARSGVELAKLDYYPDVDVGVRYRQREDRDDFASFMLTIPLPVWSSHKEGPELESRKHELERYRSLYRDRRDELEFQLEDAWYEWKRIRDQRTLYREQLIPQSEATLESSLSDYRVGNIDFVSLLEAEREWFRVKSEFIRLRADSMTTLSTLTRLLGYQRMEEWQ